jgi:DNA-binding SARP family transcriptional activator
LTVVGPDGPVVNAAAQPKRLALLALLARAGERGVTRDKALGYFWPDAEEDRARRSLANMLWALKRDLGSEELFLSGNDLRLNPEVVSSDVGEFEDAIGAGDLAHAATLYEGPFLDGFRLAGAPEFDRWVDTERSALTHTYVGIAEKLARSAEVKGDADAAVAWWRKVAAHDPLNGRLAVGLMKALVAAGDRMGAVRHAQIYEALIEQELGLPPDYEVVALAKQLRDTPPATVAPERAASEPRQVKSTTAPLADTAVAGLAAPTDTPNVVADTNRGLPPVIARAEAPATIPVHTLTADRSWPRRAKMLAWVGAAAVVGAAIVATNRNMATRPKTNVPVLALGQITDYRADRSTELVKPLTDMLATALAQCTALRVVSTARMYELTSRMGPPGGTPSPQAYAGAARAAGATELLEGALYAVDDSTLRLDLRRIDLATGNVRQAYSIAARGPFALADSGTARLLADFDAELPTGSIADVTTSSLTAYRFYEEGLRAYYQDDMAAAERLFTAALAEDSTFASAAYYLSLSLRIDDGKNPWPILERAVRLAARASDRERLTIRANWESATTSAGLRATAESLLTRFPQEVQGYLFTGIVHVSDGRFLEAVPFLERAISMDSLSLRGERAQCHACEAFRWLISSYEMADSFALAEREARRWLEYQPNSGLAYMALLDVLENAGKEDEAAEAWRKRSTLAPGRESAATVGARLKLKSGLFDEADQMLTNSGDLTTGARRAEAAWYLALSERYQGRLAAALKHAEEEERLNRSAYPTPPPGTAAHAQVLLEMGRYREAAAEFDRIARWNPPSGTIGRHRAWYMTHAAGALAAVGDTADFPARADSVQRFGSESLVRLHRELHHHVRGLLLAARRRDDEAIAEFRMAMYSPTAGYTRTNLELARALQRRGRPAEAIATLQSALHGGVEASNYFVTGTELHELLAQAWDSLGSTGGRGAALPPRVTARAAADSAAAHYRWVARAWRRGDPPFAARATHAEARAAVLHP